MSSEEWRRVLVPKGIPLRHSIAARLARRETFSGVRR